MIDKTSEFYITATKMLNDYVLAGGNVDDIGVHSDIYKVVKKARLKDSAGNYIDIETKFKLLGYPRKAKSKDSKQTLINEVNAYKQAGKSFHITRKKLPFYPRLVVYAKNLKLHGVDMTYEQIMKGLGYKDYSDTYFRCLGLCDLKNYRDNNGFVDSYRKNEKLKAYIGSVGRTLNLPYYLVVTLLADEKLEKCYIDTEYINHVKVELQQFVKDNGSLKGLKSKNKKLYYKFRTMKQYYGDGSEVDLTTEDWLSIFELGDVENNFRQVKNEEIDVKDIMDKLKQKFGKSIIHSRDVDSKEYYIILKKSINLGIPIKELFRDYGLSYNGNVTNRLSTMQVDKIPYLDEMTRLRDKLLQAQGITAENGYCKEELFEAKVEATKQAYNKFKDKMFNFTIDETNNLEDVTNF